MSVLAITNRGERLDRMFENPTFDFDDDQESSKMLVGEIRPDMGIALERPGNSRSEPVDTGTGLSRALVLLSVRLPAPDTGGHESSTTRSRVVGAVQERGV